MPSGWHHYLGEDSSYCILGPTSWSAFLRMLFFYYCTACSALLPLSSSLLSEGWEDLRILKIPFLTSLGRQCRLLPLMAVCFLLPLLHSLVLWEIPEGVYTLSLMRWQEFSSQVQRGPSCSAPLLEHFYFYPQADFLYTPRFLASASFYLLLYLYAFNSSISWGVIFS